MMMGKLPMVKFGSRVSMYCQTVNINWQLFILSECSFSVHTARVFPYSQVQVNLDMTDLMGSGKLVRHMQNPSYTYDEY